MRSFCTEGPIDKKKNYYVPRTQLLKTGMKKVDESRYFTLFAPRQSGKTTYFQMLIDEIRIHRLNYLPVWVSFESFGDISKRDFLLLFYNQIKPQIEYTAEEVKEIPNLELYFQGISVRSKKELILIIDEIEGLKNMELLNTFMHTIRSIYHRKEAIGLKSVILAGVSNITGIIQDSASPFNIADQLDIPYFTREEVYGLLSQHEEETGQIFEEQVKEGIYLNTLGQPGLVGALARDLVEKKCPQGQTVTMDRFYKTIDDFTRVYIDKNISNVLNKAKQYPEIILKILFGEGIIFDTSDERISYLNVNGVIDDCDGICCIPVPVYKKRIYNAFKPKINGEKKYFLDIKKRMDDFLFEDGTMNIPEIIESYRKYLKRRGNIIFNNPNEGEYQYNLDAYLHSICDFLGADLYPEVPEGDGRVDLLILFGKQKCIIETKTLYNISYIRHGKEQLLEYLKRSGIKNGYIIFFTESEELESYENEEIEEKTIHTWIIPVKVKNPSEK